MVLPDEPERLRDAIAAARDSGVDVVLTVGSTGVGPRDIAPDVVGPLLDRQLPGIMEVLRVRFGLDNPRARLSRGVAGVTGLTQVYTLPGSVRAVGEYVPEIMATVEHLLYMLDGLDAH